MIIRFSNRAGTRIRINYDDGHHDDVPTTDPNARWVEILALVATGDATILPFEESAAPAEAGRKKARRK